MRHVLLLSAPATGTRGMVHAPAAALLIAPAGGALRVAPRLLSTAALAVDLAAVAATADEHLSAAADAQKQPAERSLGFRFARAWTTSIRTWRFRSAPCLPIRQGVTAPVCARPGRRAAIPRAARADLWICGQRKGVAHKSTGPATAVSFSFDDGEQQASPPRLPRPDSSRSDGL
jgi:hypothetical protein